MKITRVRHAGPQALEPPARTAPATGLGRPTARAWARLAAPATGFTLVEALIAVVLLGFAALGAASAEAWNARVTALAEAREDAAAAAELVLDSLVHVPAPPASGGTRVNGVDLDWMVVARGGSAAEIRLRARGRGPAVVADSFGAVWAPPPPTLAGAP